MRFQVPQFIEVEDKIFGPLTLKQFIYLAGGTGVSLIVYLFLPHILAFIIILPILGFTLTLAFYKVNNKPFVGFLESATMYALHPKLYIWHQEQKQAPQEAEKAEAPIGDISPFIPSLSDSKLKDLTWTLDTKESLNPVTKNDREDKI